MINTVKTFTLLALLVGILCVAVACLWGQSGLWLGFLIGFGVAGCRYWFSDKLTIRRSKHQPLSESYMTQHQKYQYRSIMAELTTKAGMPMPKLYVLANSQAHAFTTGRNPDKAAVCITYGLLSVMAEDEIRGVLAHELAHIRNRDVLIVSVGSAIVMTIICIAIIASHGILFFGTGNDHLVVNAIMSLMLIVTAHLPASLIQLAVRRNQEFQADESAAALMGDAQPLADALQRLDMYSNGDISCGVNTSQAPSCIVNPLKAQAKGSSKIDQLFSDHPPRAERIRRLESWKKQAGKHSTE